MPWVSLAGIAQRSGRRGWAQTRTDLMYALIVILSHSIPSARRT